MVFANGVDGNVVDEHHLLMPLVELLDEQLAGILVQAGEYLLVHARDARGRLAQPLAVGVLPHALEDEPDALLDLGRIHPSVPRHRNLAREVTRAPAHRTRHADP